MRPSAARRAGDRRADPDAAAGDDCDLVLELQSMPIIPVRGQS
jgi:hypothetical protein